MPVTPLHFGPALVVREVVGRKNFGIWSFATTQVAFDLEPIIRILFDLEGKLHETTHTPVFGVIYALLAIALCWRWEKRGAVVGAIFGSVTHLWLDALYHADVAEMVAKWGSYQNAINPAGVEVFCFFTLILWALISGVKALLQERT